MFRAAVLTLALALAPSLANADIYFGSLHGHTRYSDGQGTPAQAFAWARQYYDFYAVTDHGELLTSAEWKDVGTQADRANVNGTFVALRGFEYSNPFQGHACVWNTTSFTSYFLSPTPELFYRWVDGRRGSLGSFNHPGDPAGAFRLFRFAANAADNMVALETGNGGDSNATADYWQWYLYALGQGWKVAPVYGEDNHSLATPAEGRTAIHAAALTRTALLDALRARRVYSTDDPDLLVYLFAGPTGGSASVPMGSTMAAGNGDVTFDVAVEDQGAETITKLELWTENALVLASFEPQQPATSATWKPRVWPVTPGQWVLLRVETLGTDLQSRVAFTAPIWFQ